MKITEREEEHTIEFTNRIHHKEGIEENIAAIIKKEETKILTVNSLTSAILECAPVGALQG